MRWYSFVSSSVQLKTWFEESLIPVLVEDEQNHEINIKRLIEAYDYLMLNIPKILSSWVEAGSDSDSEDDKDSKIADTAEGTVTLSPSSVLQSIPSSSFSMFSNQSNRDELPRRTSILESSFSRRLPSHSQRTISIKSIAHRRQSEPVKHIERTNSLNAQKVSQAKKPDRARRALFSSPDRNPERQVNPPPERKRKRLQTTEVKDTPAKNQTYTRSQRVKARIRRSRTQSKSGISVVAESPERKTKFTGANPNLNFNTDQFKPTKTLQKLISVDESLNNSRAEFFSPPKDGYGLVFGSGSSSEDELVSRSVLDSGKKSPSPFPRSVSLDIQSPIKIGSENCENFSAKRSAVRRSLLQSYSPRVKRSLAPNLTAENVLEDENPIGDSLVALEKGTILTPKQDRTLKSNTPHQVRRQLKLSECEDK